MEEVTSILLSEVNPAGTDRQQQSPDGNVLPFTPANHLKLVETENKLNRVFEEYSGRIESFMMMLDTLKEGLVVVNRVGEVCYANDEGNSLAQEIEQYSPNTNLLAFAELEAEKSISIKPDNGYEIHVRSNNFQWNGEVCNMFTIEKVQVVINETPIAVPVTPPSNEPFNTLISYVHLIAEHEVNGKPDEAVACAELAGKTVLLGEKLLADVKTFVALANYKLAITQVSMQKVVGDVLKSMGPEIEEAEIEISVSELPETTGDKELILKLIRHLVSNAVKFRNKSRKPVIDIGHDKSDGQYIFCVRDNGIGISKKHHEEVFQVFNTLNEQHQLPCNGMGLAICKKIVELHEGKIWVESLPGHGSNFYFKLNAK